jgi:AdoMet-dependent heme synthase
MDEDEVFSRLLAKVSAKRILFSCQLDLTYHCNLNCAHCYVKEEDRPELETSEIKHIIDELAEMNTLYLSLSGGEVLTREDFFEIGKHARKLNFALIIMTNGLLIDEEVADKLADLSPDLINISIYSTNPKIHDKITGVPGSLEKAIKAVKMIKERGIRVKISTVIMKENINDYSQVYDLAQNLGAEFSADPQITPKLDGDRSNLISQIDAEKLYEVLADPILKLDDYNEEMPSEVPSDSALCGAAHRACYISPYGDVFPCVQFHILCGNLKEDTLEEIWYHSPQMLTISSLKISDLPVCSQCEHISYCRYCPGLGYLEEGDVLAPPKRNCQEALIISQIKK